MITIRRRLANYLNSQKNEGSKQEVPAILLPEAPKETIQVKNTACSKCGKEFTRGLYMHEKYCKGV